MLAYAFEGEAAGMTLSMRISKNASRGEAVPEWDGHSYLLRHTGLEPKSSRLRDEKSLFSPRLGLAGCRIKSGMTERRRCQRRK